MSDFRIVWISDLHMNIAGDFYAGTDLVDIAAKINGLAPDIIVNTGDLTVNATVAEHAVFEAFGALVDSSIYSVPGNHDEGIIGNYDDVADRRFSVDFDTFRAIGVFTQRLPAPDLEGEMDASELAYLEGELKNRGAKGAVVICHNPLNPAWFGNITIGDTEFYNLLDKYNANILLSGHTHTGLQYEVIDGTIHMGGNAVSYHGGPPRPPGDFTYIDFDLSEEVATFTTIDARPPFAVVSIVKFGIDYMVRRHISNPWMSRGSGSFVYVSEDNNGNV